MLTRLLVEEDGEAEVVELLRVRLEGEGELLGHSAFGVRLEAHGKRVWAIWQASHNSIHPSTCIRLPFPSHRDRAIGMLAFPLNICRKYP